MNVCCPNIMDPKRPAQGMVDLKKAGFENILLYPSVRYPSKDDTPEDEKKIREYAPESILERYGVLVRECGKNGIGIPLMGVSHVYTEPDRPDNAGLLEKATIETMELCREAGCRKLIIYPLYRNTGEEEEFNVNYCYYLRIAEKARKYGICLLLTNQLKVIGGHMVRGMFSEPGRVVEYIDRLNREMGSEVFGFCLDTAVCDICGNDMNTFVTALGDRIKAVMLSDSDKRGSGGIIPFTSSQGDMMHADWLGLIRGLRTTSFNGEMVVNFNATRRAFPPLLKFEIIRLSRIIGEYFKWQVELEHNIKKYDKRVLFGAGNMCRNYMKCYGEKYPPLFTCDNNSKLWGTTFEGLEVKNPEELKNLPKNCCVFICNIYYREIEAQLRGMGIENIEYFNDEYMPSFYFDRIERENV